MKALTIRQPWASLIAEGRKRFEFRSWTTTYRGPVLIHAGLRGEMNVYRALGRSATDPLGYLIAIVRLVDVHLITEATLPHYIDGLPYVPYVGEYAWQLQDIQPLDKPIPYRGALGLFTVPSPCS